MVVCLRRGLDHSNVCGLLPSHPSTGNPMFVEGIGPCRFVCLL